MNIINLGTLHYPVLIILCKSLKALKYRFRKRYQITCYKYSLEPCIKGGARSTDVQYKLALWISKAMKLHTYAMVSTQRGANCISTVDLRIQLAVSFGQIVAS